MIIKMSDFYKRFKDFILRKDNPHQVTASQIDAHTKEELNLLVDPYFKNTFFPLSSFTILNNDFSCTDLVTTSEKITFNLRFNPTGGGTFFGLRFSPGKTYKMETGTTYFPYGVWMTITNGEIDFVTAPLADDLGKDGISTLVLTYRPNGSVFSNNGPQYVYKGKWFMIQNKRLSSTIDSYVIPALGDEDVFK